MIPQLPQRSPQHLSDEAIAAFADGVLRGHARDRAARHTASCPECAHDVAVQREAVWALRAAPAPPLPTGLLDRLRTVPTTTPVTPPPPTVPDERGRAMFATFGNLAAAAFVAAGHAGRSARHHDADGPTDRSADPSAEVSADGSTGLPGSESPIDPTVEHGVPHRSRRLWPW